MARPKVAVGALGAVQHSLLPGGVRQVRQVFDKGNDFAAEITYTAKNAKTLGQRNLSLGKLDGVGIPLRFVPEQERLIVNFTEAQDATSRAGRAAERQRIRGTALRRSLVAAAIHGELAA